METRETRKHVLDLALHGFSYRCIQERTGLNNRQIYMILRGNGVKIKDYRDGGSDQAVKIIKSLRLPKISMRKTQKKRQEKHDVK